MHKQRETGSIEKTQLNGLTISFRRISLHTVSFKVRLKDERFSGDSRRLEVETSFAAVDVCAIKSIPGLSFNSDFALSPQCLPVHRWVPAHFADFRCLSSPYTTKDSRLETRKN